MEYSQLRGRAASASTSPARSRSSSPVRAPGSLASAPTIARPGAPDAARLAQIQQRVMATFGALAPQAELLLDLPGRVLSITGTTVMDSIAGAAAGGPGHWVEPKHVGAVEDLLWNGDDNLVELAKASTLLLTALAAADLAAEAGETGHHGPAEADDKHCPRDYGAGDAPVRRGQIAYYAKEIQTNCVFSFRHHLIPGSGLDMIIDWSSHVAKANAGSGAASDALLAARDVFHAEVDRIALTTPNTLPDTSPDFDRLFLSFVLLALHDTDGLWPFLVVSIHGSPDPKTAMALARVIMFSLDQTRDFARPASEPLDRELANKRLGVFDEIDIMIRETLRPIGFPEDQIHRLREIGSTTVWALYKAFQEPDTFDAKRVPIINQMRQELLAVMKASEAAITSSALRV